MFTCTSKRRTETELNPDRILSLQRPIRVWSHDISRGAMAISFREITIPVTGRSTSFEEESMLREDRSCGHRRSSWRWMGIVLSAILFGLSHLYQGPAGVVSVTLEGLILALWYMRSGRIFPLIISHYLYDAVQIVQVVILIRQGVIVM